ncbi:unnamed protein product [Penicillium glandicola]
MDQDTVICDLVPEGDTNHFHTQNAHGESFRDTLVRTPTESSPLQTKIKIIELHHGTMQDGTGKLVPSTLLVFNFEFWSRAHDRRYKSARVSLKFSDEGPIRRNDPEVNSISPFRKHTLHKTEYDQKVTHGTSLGAQGGSLGVTGNASVHWEVEKTHTKQFHVTLTGETKSGKDQALWDNKVTWTMEENTDRHDGIPAFLQAAVLLERKATRPFIARLKIKSNVDPNSKGARMIKYKTDKDPVIDSVVLNPSVMQMKKRNILQLSQADLERMDQIKIDRYFQLNLSEQDRLTSVESAPVETVPVGRVPVQSVSIESVPVEPLEDKAELKLATNRTVPTQKRQTDICNTLEADTLRSTITVALHAAKAASAAASAAAEASAAAVATAEAILRVINSTH